MAAPPIALNDVIRCTYWQRLFSQRVYTVLHYRCTVAPAGGTTEAAALLNLATRLAATGSTPLSGWRALVGAELHFDEVRAQRVYLNRSVYQRASIGVTGTNLGSCNTSNIAASITKRTLFPGRHGVGRVQMAGIPDTVIVAGELDPTYQASVEATWLNLVGDITVAADSSKYRCCLFKTGPIGDEHDLFDVTAQPTVRTMHRRTVRLGE